MKTNIVAYENKAQFEDAVQTVVCAVLKNTDIDVKTRMHPHGGRNAGTMFEVNGVPKSGCSVTYAHNGRPLSFVTGRPLVMNVRNAKKLAHWIISRLVDFHGLERDERGQSDVYFESANLEVVTASASAANRIAGIERQ